MGSDNGESLPGATVVVEGTTNGTITNVDGQFSLEVPNPNAVLIISFIGYVTEKVPVNGRSQLDVVLKADVDQLDEIVVVGYGEQKRSNITGAISSVKPENLENKTRTRLDQALQGESAGVFVTQNGGAPGASPTIHIRGVGSINNTEPLWIVDGVRMAPGNHFDISDVESIEVLKDAASAAIYGAKAAHGVILVKTKRGSGKTRVNFKANIGQRSPLNLPTLLGSEDFIKYQRIARLNAGQNPEPAWDNWEHNTNWIDAYYAGSGMLQSYDFNVSKGDEHYNLYFSLGYDDEEGILIDNTYQRLSGRLNADIRITDWLKIGESLLVSKVRDNPIDNFNEDYSGGIPYRSIPIMPIRDVNNPYGGWGQGPVYFQGPNPVASQYQQHNTRDYNRIDANVYTEIRPLEGLYFRGTVGYNYLGYIGEQFNEAFHYGAFKNTINELIYSSANDYSLLGNVVGSYEKSLARHNLKLMLGYEASRYDARHFNTIGTNFPVDFARSLNLATGAIGVTDRYSISPQERILSRFGRFNYNYADKYLLEVNVRRDASGSKFGPSNVWGVFPSLSAGWRISEEKFFEHVPYITTLKLRVSTGKLGSDNIPSFIFLKTYTSQFDSYSFDASGSNKVGGFYVSRFPNEDVKWEEVHMHNIALDATAFKNKLRFSVDYYIKDTKDLLFAVPIPASVGIAVHNFNPVNPPVNIGTLRNTGVDLELGYRTTFSKWDLSLSGNTSFMKNEMMSLNNGQYIMAGSAGQVMGGMARTEAGMPISSFYGYVVRQVLNTPDDVYAINTWAADGTYQEAATAPGDFMYWDLSGPDGKPDGEVSAEHDRVFIGNPWPKMTYALNINTAYNKMFDVSVQLQGVQGVDVFNADKAYSRNFFGDNNTTTRIYEAWTPDNHSQHPRVIANDPNGNFSRPSSYFVEDGSYLKLRNLQLGFNMPASYLERVKLSRLRFFLNGNNLLTFTRYSGLDPEIAGGNTSRGIDYGLYPQVRTFSAGIDVQF